MITKISLTNKRSKKNVYTDTLSSIENDPNLLKRLITCEECVVFSYEAVKKKAAASWSSWQSNEADNIKNILHRQTPYFIATPRTIFSSSYVIGGAHKNYEQN